MIPMSFPVASLPESLGVEKKEFPEADLRSSESQPPGASAHAPKTVIDQQGKLLSVP